MENPTSTMDIFCIIVSVIALFMGVYQIYKKELFGKRNNEFTTESVKKWGPIEGVIYVVLGVVGILMSLTGYGILPRWIFWPGMILIFLGIVGDAILIKKKLVSKVKKNNGIDVQKHMLK